MNDVHLRGNSMNLDALVHEIPPLNAHLNRINARYHEAGFCFKLELNYKARTYAKYLNTKGFIHMIAHKWTVRSSEADIEGKTVEYINWIKGLVAFKEE
ncbi:hypothetical protein TNIN_164421 [Trichonephila inaurata madagascariensis]|nr:hypothetical protein TNIN_164421 [Trichonephila inaurata madagascariensis]